MLTCLPIECWSSVGEEMAPYNTETFYMLHSVDMKILEASPNVFFYTGYHDHELEGTSWYTLVHHEDLPLARTLHSKMIQFGTKVERSSGLIRLVSISGCQQCASVTISECDTIRHSGKNGVIGCFITQTHIIRQSEVEFFINEVANNNILTGYSFSQVDDGESMPSQPLAPFENHIYEDLENITNINTTDVMEPNVPNIDSHYNRMPCNFNACETPLKATDERVCQTKQTQLMMYKPFEALKSAAKLLVCDRLKRDVDKFRIPYSHAMEIIHNLDQSEYCNQTQPSDTPTNQDTAFFDELASLPLMTYACSSHDNVSGYVQVTCQSQVTMGIPGQVQPPGNWS
ncbi:uncharacterized protein LOC117122473 [Anneissia japonica]|uniref:uncharacterized protein LOC117122473 n=1 Tax=Anneissia japonica TaxID=1529436 RepID=UPI0014259A51|nr:uncharacterized protein LOC117122473 [Anneissia japonica]